MYDAVTEFASRFRDRNRTLHCRELLGCDISTPEEMRRAREDNLLLTICPKMVADAAQILEEMNEQRP